MGTTVRDRITQIDWDETITDGGIYLLAFGGFYVGYQTLYAQALRVGFPGDQAMVVAALADLAILLYSRKAVREVKAGRPARIIRLIVALFSVATFGLQLRAAWPDPLAVAFHALPPAVWIIGHEMMLRGNLRDAKAKLRAAKIAAGLLPAALPAIRLSWWLLDTKNTFFVWRRVKLWEQAPADVIRNEIAERQAKQGSKKKIPAAWQGYLAAAPAPAVPTPFQHTTCGPTFFTVAAMMAKLPPATVLYRLSDESAEVPADEVKTFLRFLPEPPVKGRPKDKAMAYIRDIDALSAQYDIAVTDKYIAQLLQVSPSRVSRLRDAIREEDAAAAAAQTTRP
jgi:hypothetical protein